jgi:LysR family nitrogen assimilation transcriptional regulator
MRGTLDFRRLRYFLVIADCGSMSAAARALNLAQPALSYHVAELERLTGHTLFDRSRDGVKLTEAGRLLRQHANGIVERVETAEKELDRLARNRALPATRVRLAIITSLAADLTPLLVECVAESLPSVKLHIIESGTRDMVQRLERGTVDMALYLVATAGRNEQPIASEQLFFVSPAKTDAPKGEGTIRLVDLARQPLVLPAPGNPLREFVEASARQHGLTLDVVLEIDGSRPRWTAVHNGIGGTVLGAHTVTSEELDPGLSIREIVSPKLFRPIYLGVRRELDPLLAGQMRDVLAASLAKLGLQAHDGSTVAESML